MARRDRGLCSGCSDKTFDWISAHCREATAWMHMDHESGVQPDALRLVTNRYISRLRRLVRTRSDLHSCVHRRDMTSITRSDQPTSKLVETLTDTIYQWTTIRDASPLTTIFTYEPSRVGRWLAPTQDGSLLTIWSTLPTTSPSDYTWLDCQPFRFQHSYSPGMCPDHQTLAAITEIQGPVSSGTSTRWFGRCCPR
jgi:hypothetical protein